METINGEFVMKGCEKHDPSALLSLSDALSMIHAIGFLPLFSNSIPGFSVEEHVPDSHWWTGNPETDPWEWRQILASDPYIAYGKFFNRSAGFVSKDYFPAFANYRRNGYDFDSLFEDELASYRSKKIMDVFELNDEAVGRSLLSPEVKALAGFGKRANGSAGEKNFEGCLAGLQMQTYLILSDFRQRKNKKGIAYGWHIAVVETPETKWGRSFVTSGYKEEPVESWTRIVSRIKQFFPDAQDDQIKKILGIKYPGETANTQTKKRKTRKSERKNMPKNMVPTAVKPERNMASGLKGTESRTNEVEPAEGFE